MTVFISGDLNLSSPSYTPRLSSSAVMSVLQNDPQQILKRATHTIMWDFLSNGSWASCCRTFKLPQPSLISVKVVMTGPGHTKHSTLLSDGADGCLKLNILHVACKCYFMSLICESTDRFSESASLILLMSPLCIEEGVLVLFDNFWQTSSHFHWTKTTFFFLWSAFTCIFFA